MLLEESTSVEDYVRPSGYKGLYGFHKYWGKKPAETVSYIVERLSEEGNIVADPFMGFGAIARESAIRKRRFLGNDINPVAIELASLLVQPPSAKATRVGLRQIEKEVRKEIESSYLLKEGGFLYTLRSHYYTPPPVHRRPTFPTAPARQPLSIQRLAGYHNINAC